MPPLHHRSPGLAAACLNEPEIQAEVIADGVHLAPEVVRLAVRAKGPDRVILITDAMAAVGRPDGAYTLGRNRVIVRGDVCLLEDGVTIASSMLTMNRAVANARRFAGVPLTEAVRMATLVPAQVCGCAGRKGSIETGKDADLAVLRPDFSVAATVLAGEVVYRADSVFDAG
jgi:N-acetylglucosamine-6-phosphate deacetylase